MFKGWSAHEPGIKATYIDVIHMIMCIIYIYIYSHNITISKHLIWGGTYNAQLLNTQNWTEPDYAISIESFIVSGCPLGCAVWKVANALEKNWIKPSYVHMGN